MSNILVEEFYQQLAAHGPPSSIYYGDTFKSIYGDSSDDDKELLLCDEICYRQSVVEYIVNPSTLVTVAAIFQDPEYYNKLPQPNKQQLLSQLYRYP